MFTNILTSPYFGSIQYPLKSRSLPWRRWSFACPSSWRTTPYRMSATNDSLHLQL